MFLISLIKRSPAIPAYLIKARAEVRQRLLASHSPAEAKKKLADLKREANKRYAGFCENFVEIKSPGEKIRACTETIKRLANELKAGKKNTERMAIHIIREAELRMQLEFLESLKKKTQAQLAKKKQRN